MFINCSHEAQQRIVCYITFPCIEIYTGLFLLDQIAFPCTKEKSFPATPRRCKPNNIWPTGILNQGCQPICMGLSIKFILFPRCVLFILPSPITSHRPSIRLTHTSSLMVCLHMTLMKACRTNNVLKEKISYPLNENLTFLMCCQYRKRPRSSPRAFV